MKRILTTAAILLLSGLPAHAASNLVPLLGTPGDCFARNYDAAHLRSHPAQVVKSIFITYDTSYQDANSDLTLHFQFTTRSGAAFYGTGICEGNVCGIEGDLGAFSLSPHRDGLLLKVDPKRGMSGEVFSAEAGRIYGSDYSADLYDSDDREFLLYPARPAACEY